MVGHTSRLCLALGLAACAQTQPPTELLVVVDTDLVGTIDRIEIDVTDVDGSRMESRGAEVRKPGDVPVTLALLNASGTDSPLDIHARAMSNGTVVVDRSARVRFVAEETRTVPLHLAASCVGVDCSASSGEATSCAPPGKCEPLAWSSAMLPPLGGDLPRLPVDGGSATADGSVGEGGQGDAGPDPAEDAGPMPDGGSTDAMTDSDAGGMCGTGGSVDTQTDPLHCGGCNSPCPVPDNGSATCTDGSCGVKCATGWGTCGLADPCTTSLNTAVNCGKCGKACTPPFCSNGMCVSG